MKKIILMSLISILLVASVFAVNPNNNGQSGKSEMNHLYLFEKNPTNWNIVEGGAWGKMTFDDNNFVFNGHGLEAGTDYSLIYYPDINKYTLNFKCITSCSGIYSHTMITDMADETGFTGHGYYNLNQGYTWNVAGTERDSFILVYTGINAGYSVTCNDGSCSSSSGQTFDLEIVDTGSAVWSHPIEVLGTSVANEEGNVHITDNFGFTSIPWAIDLNAGAKIWLVKSDDIVAGKLSGWNPTEYLFEYSLI